MKKLAEPEIQTSTYFHLKGERTRSIRIWRGPISRFFDLNPFKVEIMGSKPTRGTTFRYKVTPFDGTGQPWRMDRKKIRECAEVGIKFDEDNPVEL